MRTVKLVWKFFVMAFALMVMVSRPAHAYLDAGTGSMAVQVLLGGSAGVVVLLQLAWDGIKTRLGLSRTACNK